jgi:diguanylate cyclase (GGDEF)-like protein
MRPLALVGLLLSLMLAGVSVFSTAETVTGRRNTQDRSLEEAVASQVERVLGSQRQMHAAASQMLVNEDVRGLLVGSPSSPAVHARELVNARAALEAFRSESMLPLSSACIDDPSGREAACVPTVPFQFPAALEHHFAALAAASPSGAGTRAFFSPLTARPTVAFVAPLRLAGATAGVVHFDIDLAFVEGSRLVFNGIPGVRMQLAGYEDGDLVLPSGLTQPLKGTVRRPGSLSQISHGPWSIIVSGHRALVATVPLAVGDLHRQLAVVAVSSSANPGFFNGWKPGALTLLGLALLTLLGSLAGVVGAHRRMRQELNTDPLTRLRNRRALMDELPRVCQRASEERPAYLWFFDLDGFKAYNDSFGHLAGDALLARLGQRLRSTVAGTGTTYRLGGDEFCVLVSAPLADPLGAFETAREALCERGGAFTVTASAGAVEIPREAALPTHALRLADQHMYRDKASGRTGGAAELVTAVLHAALAQRHPELDEHSSDVADDVEHLARAVGLDEETVEMIVQAGDLHDVGKLGIPDEIIAKPGPLSEREWEFMRQHTVMGERIIAAAGPSLQRIAPLVRSSHERWDGNGYPDGLSGEQIPLGARIITICDAYRAMLTARPYKRSVPFAEALEELRRCAGSQFDPYLVARFCEIATRADGEKPGRQEAASQLDGAAS